ncbi:MAG: endonuclease/exonuclease/phosphatase family protein [Rhodothermales bacterium]
MKPSVRRIRTWVFLALDAGLLAAFLGGYLGRYVHPSWFWWFQLLAIALPYVATALVPATVAVAFARRKGWLRVHLAALLLAAIRFFPFHGTAEAAGELRMLSFNIGHLEPFTAAQSEDVLLALTDDIESDLYVLQDLLIRYRRREQRIVNYPNLEGHLEDAGVTVHAEGAHRIETTFQPVWARTERVRLLEEERIKMATDDSVSMGVTRVRFAWEGREAVLYNVHLRTFGMRKPWNDAERSLLSIAFWRSYLGQYRQAFLLRAIESESIRALMDRETLPVIVSGDFNSTVHNWSYYHLARGMQDAFVVAGSGFGNTYHSHYPMVRIDHVLASKAWAIREAEVVRSITYSDHLPLRVVLGWRVE